MTYPRVLTIQDISCVGQCSMTVALPILSVCAVETCVLPTALLSTHTGGFGKPAVVHFDGMLNEIWRHWQENGITFDTILVGYLGSLGAVQAAGEIIDHLRVPGGKVIVDPAMADHGKLYSGFDSTYAQAVGALCRKSDVVLPNLTEAAILAGIPYDDSGDEAYANRVLDGLPFDRVVLTGVDFGDDQIGVILREGTTRRVFRHRRIGGSCHGTGDIFAAAFSGAVANGKEPYDAVKIAASFTCQCVEYTVTAPAHWYGVKFEPVLPELIQMLR